MNEQKKSNHCIAAFKESAIKLAIENDQPITKTAEDLGIKKNTLRTWISKFHQVEKPEIKQAEDEHLYDELKRLRKENKRLTEERNILKKAAAYFAKESL